MLDVGDRRTRISADVTNDLAVKSPVDDPFADDGSRIVDAQLRRHAGGRRRGRGPMAVMKLFLEKEREEIY